MPLKIKLLASVARKAGTPSTAISSPFSAPQTAPTAATRSTTSAGCAPSELASAIVVSESEIWPAMETSMPPDAVTIAQPAAMTSTLVLAASSDAALSG